MTDETLDSEEWLAAQAREVAREDPGKHPSVESIFSYQARELPTDEGQEIQKHLAACPDCSRLLLALSDALTGDFGRSETADGLDAEEDWRRLRTRIAEELKPSAQAASQHVQIPTRRWRETRTYALAAILCVAVTGLSIFALRENWGTTTKPSPIYVPSASMARSVDLIKRIEIEPGEENDLSFVLEAPVGISFPGYGLEVRDAKGRIVLRRDTVVRQPDGFAFMVSPNVLTEGRFEIQVKGLREGNSTIVGKYWIEVNNR